MVQARRRGYLRPDYTLYPDSNGGNDPPIAISDVVGLQDALSNLTAVSFNHNQLIAAPIWVIAHNLGFKPQVQAFSSGGVEMLGDVQHTSDNIVTITFATSLAGYARLV